MVVDVFLCLWNVHIYCRRFDVEGKDTMTEYVVTRYASTLVMCLIFHGVLYTADI